MHFKGRSTGQLRRPVDSKLFVLTFQGTGYYMHILEPGNLTYNGVANVCATVALRHRGVCRLLPD